jgi:hypothetical protein
MNDSQNLIFHAISNLYALSIFDDIDQKAAAILLYSSSICALFLPLVSIWNLKLINIERKDQILKIKNMIEPLQSVEHPITANPATPQLIAFTM